MLIVLVIPNLKDFKQNLDWLKAYLDTMMSVMRNKSISLVSKGYMYFSFPGRRHFEIWQIKHHALYKSACKLIKVIT